ncbi:hypothetical protein CkaCkLH20_11431 [Colletotrichum karsti]|uniref:Uncharacterized protein n=1 Tax=Colletotrichum karsti TaxID=1095194 RepID=A0A9P6HVA3_9PEZI|nr:uncharacterized protein CkaCkLH20_11431 [Colletotrichum karsti]KAF9871014.1 hypothetical protein CkaCkLH20_11431 [Colletotrichum karsti]
MGCGRRSESLTAVGSTPETIKRTRKAYSPIMKATLAYVIAAAIFGVSQAAVTPLNNILRHEYNLNARAGVHGNLGRRDEVEHAPEADVLQPVV